MPTVVRRYFLPRTSYAIILGGGLLLLALLQAYSILNQKCEASQNPDSPKRVEFLKYKNLSNESSSNIFNSSILHNTSQTDNKNQKSKSELQNDDKIQQTSITKVDGNNNCSVKEGLFEILYTESTCLHLVVIGMFCIAFAILQHQINFVFGNLRSVEILRFQGKLWTFSLFKIILILGVINVQTINEFMMWVYWCVALVPLIFISIISKLRFNFFSFSPTTHIFQHSKIIGLLLLAQMFAYLLQASILSNSFPFLASSINNNKFHIISFMSVDCILIVNELNHVLIRYFIHLYDIRQTNLWERKATIIHYVDLLMESVELTTSLIHCIHMFIYSNIWISLTSLVILTKLFAIIREISKRYHHHVNYRNAVANIDMHFPPATAEELKENEDRCAICWDQMESARKLPCGHLYHGGCIRTWMEQDSTCPTCRKPLGIQLTQSWSRSSASLRPGQNEAPINPNRNRPWTIQNGNHWWRFESSIFANWLPRFSVHINRTPHGARAVVSAYAHRRIETQSNRNNRLQAMVRDVLEVLPETSASVVENELRRTGSVNVTITNILDGNVAHLGSNPLSNSDRLTSSNSHIRDGSELRRRTIQPSANERSNSRSELPSFSRHSAVAFTSTTSSSQSSATTTVTSTGEEGTHSQPSSSRDRPDLGVGSGADDPAQRLLPTSVVHSLNMSFVVDNDADFSSSEDESSWDFSSGDDLSSESND